MSSLLILLLVFIFAVAMGTLTIYFIVRRKNSANRNTDDSVSQGKATAEKFTFPLAMLCGALMLSGFVWWQWDFFVSIKHNADEALQAIGLNWSALIMVLLALTAVSLFLTLRKESGFKKLLAVPAVGLAVFLSLAAINAVSSDWDWSGGDFRTSSNNGVAEAIDNTTFCKEVSNEPGTSFLFEEDCEVAIAGWVGIAARNINIQTSETYEHRYVNRNGELLSVFSPKATAVANGPIAIFVISPDASDAEVQLTRQRSELSL